MLRVVLSIFVLTATSSVLAQSCELADGRVCDIRNFLMSEKEGHFVKFHYDADLNRGNISETEWVIGGHDIIHLGDTSDLSSEELHFIIAHEFYHSYSKHIRQIIESVSPAEASTLTDIELYKKYGELMTKASATIFHRHELEADAYAIAVLDAKKFDVLRAMQTLPMVLYATHNHPSKKARMENAKRVLGELNSSK